MKKDLCKTCEYYWQDFPILLEQDISHCDILDRQLIKENIIII